MQRLANQNLAQHGPHGRLAVAPTRKRRPPRTLEGDVAALTMDVDHLAQQERASVTQLRREAAELVAGISLGNGIGALG